jgi:hypothetical protein
MLVVYVLVVLVGLVLVLLVVEVLLVGSASVGSVSAYLNIPFITRILLICRNQYAYSLSIVYVENEDIKKCTLHASSPLDARLRVKVKVRFKGDNFQAS